MYKSSWLAWTFFVLVQVGVAQVKDTVRQNIDYRRNYSLPELNKRSQLRLNQNNLNRSGRSTLAGLSPRDTINEEINYRLNKRFYRTYSYKPIAPYSHFFGLQLNAIVHELSQPDSTYIKNPIVLSYSINHRRTGLGIGIGYGYTEWTREGKNSLDREVVAGSSRMHLRLSLDKKTVIVKRFVLGLGVDVLYSHYKHLSKTFINGLVDEESRKTNGWGFGPRASLLIKINKWIYIGSETSYYFRKLITESKTQFTGLPPENKATLSSSVNTYFSPTALFINVKIN
jgi:hypothetical protein